MIRVQVVNQFSYHWLACGECSIQTWKSDSFWVPVNLHGKHSMIARCNLREA